MKENLFIIGTRPEITKIAPVANKLNCKILFTGQHFSKSMTEGFFDLIKNKEIINLNLQKFKNFSDSERYLIHKITEVINKVNPKRVVVLGDTNSTLLGAIASKNINKELYFLESGMRSKDIQQIEEYNRLIVSHLADLNFCNHKSNKINLINEGINKNKIVVTGSTVFSSVLLVDKNLNKNYDENYILCTLHRPENVDNKSQLISLLKTVNKLNFKTIFPIHPRTKAMLSDFDTKSLKNIKFIKPQNYQDFLELIQKSTFIISDSGGIQEESAIYKKPLLIPRLHTERPEMLGIFNLLVKNNIELYREAKSILMKDSPLLPTVKSSKLLYGKEKAIELIVKKFDE